MIYYTSDLHFGHKNCLKFDNRPFCDIDEMEIQMIERWNKKVQPDDEVYILGDVFYNYKGDKTKLLISLNGHKHLILGNHDGEIVKDANTMQCFDSIDKMKYVQDREKKIVLCHFPIASWNGKIHGSLHFYGHIHQADGAIYEFMTEQKNAYNVGCMINNYVPCTADEIINNNLLKMKTRNLKLPISES